MSNTWKLYGLCCVDGKVLNGLNQLAQDVATMTFDDAIVAIDKFAMPRRCPMGHLEVQCFYDSLFNTNIWDGINKISGAFASMEASLEGDEYYKMIGLACMDPWQGSTWPNPTEGFRMDLLADPVKAAQAHGFFINAEIAQKLSDGLHKDGVLATMATISAEWDDFTLANLSNRKGFGRLTVFPKGWVKRFGAAKPTALH